ncbi:hypothetical protein [Tychonema sp. BBK16]|uniref:hypothetical protein n=1 Tax=Tychonema sp. BBK16 TaxID=2699888 RepID=UPI001F216812|nr:hypothetical protein [Tychonema sp. BBK16]MCF6372275.1 hypothetical protein [Tychonema sp. BBK16]
MFAQFRAIYPTGQLICELLTVHHGKFVVRSLVQVDGKTLATGMSAAESIEEAEDRARLRAIALLGLDDAAKPAIVAPVSPSPVAVVPVAVPVAVPMAVPVVAPVVVAPVAPVPVPVATPAPVAAPVLELPITTDNFAISHQSSFVNTQSPLIEEPIAPAPIPEPLPPMVDRSVAGSRQEFDSDAWLSSSYGAPIQEPSIPTTSQTEFLPVAAEVRELQPISVGIPSDAIEDISETIAQIEAILKRLKWTKKQESDCLQQSYGKMSQGILSAAELIDFLDYVQIYSKTTDEIKRLSWSPSQGKDYLKQAYGKEARHFLSKEELLDFLQYLESLPSDN